jgi:oligosaccharide repeat unit polymerase
MINISILLIMGNIIIGKFISKDILSPVVLVGIPWLLAMTFLFFTDFNYDLNNLSYLYIAIGVSVFQVGYYVFILNNRMVNRYKYKLEQINIKWKLVKYVQILESLILIKYIIQLIQVFRNEYLYNVLFTLKRAMSIGLIERTLLLIYTRTFINAFTFFLIIVYYSSSIKNKKKYKKIVLNQILICSISVISRLDRNSILLMSLTIFVIVMIVKEIKNKELLSYGVKFSLISLLSFLVFSFNKYANLLNQNTVYDLTIGKLGGYISGSLVAFQQWNKFNDLDFSLGTNTFRFFYAILNRLGYDIEVPKLVNDFITIGLNSNTNVYTIYYFYAQDFGLFYAMIIMLFLGIFHGFLYKKMCSKNPYWVYWYALSCYPLFMQFFQDQYFSLLSTWLQYLVFGFILFRSNLFIVNKRL